MIGVLHRTLGRQKRCKAGAHGLRIRSLKLRVVLFCQRPAAGDHMAAFVVAHCLELPYCAHAFEVAQMSAGGRMHTVHIGVYRKKLEFGHGEWALTRMLVLF